MHMRMMAMRLPPMSRALGNLAPQYRRISRTGLCDGALKHDYQYHKRYHNNYYDHQHDHGHCQHDYQWKPPTTTVFPGEFYGKPAAE